MRERVCIVFLYVSVGRFIAYYPKLGATCTVNTLFSHLVRGGTSNFGFAVFEQRAEGRDQIVFRQLQAYGFLQVGELLGNHVPGRGKQYLSHR